MRSSAKPSDLVAEMNYGCRMSNARGVSTSLRHNRDSHEQSCSTSVTSFWTADIKTGELDPPPPPPLSTRIEKQHDLKGCSLPAASHHERRANKCAYLEVFVLVFLLGLVLIRYRPKSWMSKLASYPGIQKLVSETSCSKETFACRPSY